MGKQLDLLRKLIKEEFELALNEKNSLTEEENLDSIVDYLLSEEELEEAKGRTKGTARLYTLKGGKSADEVKKFLKRIQSLISKKSGRGRKAANFTDEDIEVFSDLLTRPEGFTRQDILDSISFYKGKPFQAAQKMMDILGDKKMTSQVDEEGNTIEVGKGYIEVMDAVKTSKTKPEDEEVENQDTEEVDAAEFEDAADGEIDDSFGDGTELAKLRAEKDKILAKLKSGKITVAQYKKEIGNIPAKIKALEKEMEVDLEVEEDEEVMVNEDLIRLFQRRAGLLNG
jgi:hypothetical protein